MGMPQDAGIHGVGLEDFLEQLNLIHAKVSTTPVDGTTGAATANPGALLLDDSGPLWYYNAGTLAVPEWLPLGSASHKLRDDQSLRFGDKTDEFDEVVGDARFYYSSADEKFYLEILRPNQTDSVYGGFTIDAGDAAGGFFTHLGAKKSRLFKLDGERPVTGAVAGGDSNDMLAEFSYTNRALNSPAGHYARGLSVSLNNRESGTIDSLQGGFWSVRQRGDGGAIGTLRGLQLDVVANVGGAAPSAGVEGLRVEMQLEANMPAASYGVVVDNRTDGNYTEPTAAFKAINRGTSGCEGFDYGVDMMSAAGVDTVRLGEIRLSQQDTNNLPTVIFAGVATDDAGIVSQVGADTLWADGSLYISAVDGAGTLWQKRNDVWTSI